MVTLSLKEEKRLMVLNEVEKGKLKGGGAAELLDISLRHLRRLIAAYRKEGAAALAHGNRGRRPAHALDATIKARVLALAKSRYLGFNTQHFTEQLAEGEEISLSRSSVRRILLAAGIKSPRKRRAPKHRSRRERYPREGMLLQIDASHHDWLEGRGAKTALIGAIDDATGKVIDAFFREREDSEGYFRLLRHIVAKRGLPHAVYHDGHTIFVPPDDEEPSIEEQLAGREHHTQFGRLLEELGITSIRSRSPQARGRIERLWGTFQDRLVSELRLASASTIEGANQVLRAYLTKHNRRFAVAAQQPGSAFRSVPANVDSFFCFKYYRTVGLDNVVRIGPHRLQVLPSNGRASFGRARVEVHQAFGDSLSIFYLGQKLNVRPAVPEAAMLRKSPLSSTSLKTRVYAKPAPDHPWRGKFRQLVDKGSKG
jgi:transposase